MKRILVIHTKYTITGGEDIAVENEVSALKKYFDVETLYFSNKLNENIFKQVFYFLTNKNPQANMLLINKLNSFEPDLVYIHNTWFKPSLGIFKVLDRYKVKYILKIHNYRFDCGRYITKFSHFKNDKICKGCGNDTKNNLIFNKYFQDSYLKSIILLIYSKRYFKLIKNIKILTLTKFQKNYLINNGFNSENIRTLVNPIETLNYEKSKFDFDLEPKSYLIYAGLISDEKGVGLLIETYKLLVNYDKKLVIVGEGPLLNKLKNKNIGNNNIIFLGRLNNSEVLSLINNSYSVVTNTSLYEGQPTLLSEASKLGVNSIYPKSGGIAEFFPEDNPFAFNPRNEIDLLKKLKLLKHEEIVQRQAMENNNHIEAMLSTENYIDSFRESVIW